MSDTAKDSFRNSNREIVFVDPSVADIETILGSLRSGVEAILLDRVRPASRQIAAALAERRGLAAVHVIAHGAPGRVSFAAGDWSSETLGEEAEDFAAIGRALGADGDLRLWSCDTGSGAKGAAFMTQLARTTGADVSAATGRIGAAAKGGSWELSSFAQRAPTRPPLTAEAMAGYGAVFPATLTSAGKGERLAIFGRWPAGTAAGTYFIVLNNRGALEVIGKFIVPTNNMPGTFAISEPLPAGSYTIGSSIAGPGTIAVYNGIWNASAPPAGSWSPASFNPEITTTLNDTGSITSRNSSISGAVG